MTISYEDARQKLQDQEQGHVLRFWDSLNEEQRKALLDQIENLDSDALEHTREMLRETGQEGAAANIEPADVLSLNEAQRNEALTAGESALRHGRVGAILVAGGQGTRLGFDGPKGSFPVAPISKATLFEIHCHKIAALEAHYDTAIPFYIMTSEANDGPTRRFFEQHDHFGLDPSRVMFFKQGMWPALDENGKIILDRPDHIFMSPDGHGGVLAALKDRGMLADMAERGVETLFFFQVDNPLVEICDPVFVGLHRRNDAQMSLKACAKRDPEEGLGVVVERDGRNAIVEYIELTDEQKHARREDGRLKFLFGSVAIHVFSRDFMEEESRKRMPLHVAHKKVPYCDDEGRTIAPDEPSGFKFEKFIFDVLPRAERSFGLAFSREDEFSPVKNGSGKDSPETARRDMMRKFARWLEACDVDVPRDAGGEPAVNIEIDPLFAHSSAALKDKLPAGFKLRGDVLLK